MFKFEPVGTLLRQHLHEHQLPALTAPTNCSTTPRSARRARRAAPRATVSSRCEDVECIAACTEAPGPAGQLPLPLPGHERGVRPSRSTTCAPGTRRRDPAARHAGQRAPARRRRSLGAGTGADAQPEGQMPDERRRHRTSRRIVPTGPKIDHRVASISDDSYTYDGYVAHRRVHARCARRSP